MQFSASASSTLDPPRHTVAVQRLGQHLTVESAPLPSLRRVAAAGKGGGKRCELDGRRGLQRLQFCSPLIVAACTAASLTSAATWADFHNCTKRRFSWPSLSETPFGWFNSGGPAWHATRPLPFLSTSASPPLAHQQQHAGSRFSRPALWHWDNIVWDSSPTAAAARCAWVDEVLRDSVEWCLRWTFTQSFASSASILMLQTRRRWLASEELVSFAW